MSLENCRLLLSKQKSYEFSFGSVIGTRESQEDYFSVITSERSIAACICDGMGGLDCGRAASETSVRVFTDEITPVIDFCPNESPDYFLSFLDKMDHDVRRLKKPDGSRSRAGSTLIAVWIGGGAMNWLSVGDSSVYHVRSDRITRLNVYHNYQTSLDEQLSQGRIERDQYRRESRKGHALTSFIGIGGIKQFDAPPEPVPVLRNDVILLCSDGVTNNITSDELLSLCGGRSASGVVKNLFALLSEKTEGRASDNATAIVIRIK